MDSQLRSLRACSRDDPECGARRGVSFFPLVPAKAGTQHLDSRLRGNERESEATVERREASVPRYGTQGASQAPDTPRYGVSNGCFARTRTSLGAPPTPRLGVSEATLQNPGRRNAPRERDGLFEMVKEIVARIERSEIRGRWFPHFAALNAGYEATIVCPGRGAARNEVEPQARSRASSTRYGTADPGPPQTGTVPGLQRIVTLRFTLRPGHVSGPTCGCAKRPPAQFHCFRPVIYNEFCNSHVSGSSSLKFFSLRLRRRCS